MNATPLLTFLKTGLLFALGTEYFVHIFLRQVFDLPLFLVLIPLYGAYILIEYALWYHLLKKPRKTHFRNTLLYFLLFSLFGLLAIEWLWLKHQNEIWLVQIFAFSFWAVVALLPAYFTDPEISQRSKQKTQLWILILLAIFVTIGLSLQLLGFEEGKNTGSYLSLIAFYFCLLIIALNYLRILFILDKKLDKS